MGITGLLPYLKKIHTPVNISKFEGCTVAVDAYCWLHKGAFSCADKLAFGEHTDQYVYYCMKYVDCLLKKNIKPILVFDGCHLPSKGDVEKSRRERREGYRKKAAVLLREGKRTEAKECLQRCVDITAEMALQLMNACRARGVDCIVAPYEADAQLAYLNRVGIAQVIITEDSDLLTFGCDKIVFKMDLFGNGTLVEKSRLNEVLQIKSDCFTFDKFRYVCILSGCDYLPSLPGIGLAKANKVFKLARQPDLKILLRKVPSYLKMKLVVTDKYVENFIQADNTFLHQLVFDPIKRCLVPLTPYQPDMDPNQLHYAGPYLPNTKALQIALGNLDISNGKKIANFDPDTVTRKPGTCSKKGIWDKTYKVQSRLSLKETTCERANLFEKELTINANIIKKKSPVKRKREAVDSEETKCDSELVSIYDDAGPEKKRFHTDTENMENLSILSSSPEKDFGGSVSPRHKSPQKNRSMAVSAADVWSVSVNSPDSVEEKKEAPVKHNKFALKSTGRARFDLNVRRCEVRSRYFSRKEDVEVVTSHNDSEIHVEIDNTHLKNITPQTLNATNKSLREGQTLRSPEQKCGQITEQSKNSKSVFGWSKISLSTSSKISSCKNASLDLQTRVIKTEVCDQIEEVEKSGEFVADSNQDDNQDESLTDQSPSPKSRFPSPSSSTCVQAVSVVRASMQWKPTPGKSRSQCRVSGLARGTKKANQVDKDKQKSIKDMFSQFSFKKK